MAGAASPALPKPASGIAVLFLAPEIDPAYGRQLAGAGLACTNASYYDPMPYEFLKRFDVLVIDKLPIAGEEFNVFGQHMIPFWANMSNVWRCVEEGAGALVYANLADCGGALCAGWNDRMRPWGVQLMQACVVDPARKIEPWKAYGELWYTWTDRLAPHPVTEGLKRVYYACGNARWDDCYLTPPLLCDTNWTPLVTAMPTARAGTEIDGEWFFHSVMTNDLVLAAVRPCGKGRLAAIAINPAYTHKFGTWRLANKGYAEMSYGYIDGIVLSKGDGQIPSDTGALLSRLYGWLAAHSSAAGHGGFKSGDPVVRLPSAQSEEAQAFSPVLDFDNLTQPPSWRHRPAAVRRDGKTYFPELSDPLVTGELRFFKALIGAHTALSDGQGTVEQYADEARQAGYSLLVFTETFDRLSPANWDRLSADCARCTTDDLVCLPGLDIADVEGSRFVIIAPSYYPPATWLTPDGKRLAKTQMINLLYGNHMVVAHRPATSPMPFKRLKHFQGLTVATYRGGTLVDDGFEAYAWQVLNGSVPHPIVIHEMFGPAEVAVAAKTGYQQRMPYDTARGAAAYFRVGIGHYFEAPARYLISEGPIVTAWALTPKDVGPAEENRRHFRVDVGVTNDLPLAVVRLMDGPAVVRRWLPGTNVFQARADFQHSRQYDLFVLAEDVKGRRVLTSSIRTVTDRFHHRCSDRQNWLGHVGIYYTGTRLGDGLDIRMPIQGTEEGNGLFPGTPGACMAGTVNFPFTTPDVVLTEVTLRDVYVNALSRDVGYDAMPSRASKPSTVYDARVRRYSFTPSRGFGACPTVVEFDIRLKRGVAMRNPTNLFPAFGSAGGTNRCIGRNGKLESAAFVKKAPALDLPIGSAAGGYLALSEGLRFEDGRFGLKPPAPANGLLASGTAFRARFLIAGAGARADNAMASALDAACAAWVGAVGLAVPPPYTLALTRGEAIGDRTFPPAFAAKDGGIAGAVSRTAPLPFPLPMEVRGLNPNWPAGLWRGGTSVAYTGVFEGRAWPRLDTALNAPFYAGNVLTADSPDVVLEVVKWTPTALRIEAHNPTDRPIETVIRTPGEITSLKALQRKVTLPPGQTVYVE
jgi:hypothetical protein